MDRIRSMYARYRDQVTDLKDSAGGKAILATAGVSITATTLVLLAFIAIWQTIFGDMWHAAIWPFLRQTSSVPNIFIIAFILLVVACVVLMLVNQRQKGSLKLLKQLEASHTGTVLESSIADAAAKAILNDGMLTNTEKTILFLVNSIVARVGTPEEHDISSLATKALEQAITNILTIYGSRISRGHILVVDPADNNWLTCCAAVNIGANSLERRYYIGPMTQDARSRGYVRGAAGAAFLNKKYKPRGILIDPTTRLASNCKDYRDFHPGGGPRLYKVFTMLQLRLNPSDKQPYGILCLDSPYSATFDNDPGCESILHLVRIVTYLLQLREAALTRQMLSQTG